MQKNRNGLKDLVCSFVFITLVVGVATGCKKKEEVRVPVTTKKASPPVQAVSTSILKEEYLYNPLGKRDPFKSFIEFDLEKKGPTAPPTPLQAYSISEIRLVGIMILPDRKVAMVEIPTGEGYNVKVGTRIGNEDGVVVEIRKDEVVIEEKYRDEIGQIKPRKKSMTIPREQGGDGK